MGVQLAVFDLAGTTVKDNNDVPRILRQSMEKNDVMISIDDACEVMGIPKPIAIKQLLLKNYAGPQEITAEWIDEIHEDFIANMISFYRNDPFVQEKEGASELFAALKKNGIKVIVNTGFDRRITNALLDRMGWIDNLLIDGSVTSDEVYFGRPYPDMIYRAMAMTNVSHSGSVAKIGDTVSDLLEGLNAGCHFVIGVTTGAQPRKKLEEHYHTHLVENLEQVISILTSDIMQIA